MKNYFSLPAPAKLNLFLHVVGRKSNGMHLLQSVFTFIDLADRITLEELPNGQIARAGDISWESENDLCVRAAKLLQPLTKNRGVRISVEKNIPSGAGLGGGSSDAATCLIALNKLWDLNLSRTQLMELGLKLGADVPFFVFGQTAFAQGVGETLEPIEVNPMKVLLVFPGISLSTKEIFSDEHLTRNTKIVKITDFRTHMNDFGHTMWGRNDLESVVRRICPEVDLAIKRLSSFGTPRMTGSGSAVFMPLKAGTDFKMMSSLDVNWKQWSVNTFSRHPLWSWV